MPGHLQQYHEEPQRINTMYHVHQVPQSVILEV